MGFFSWVKKVGRGVSNAVQKVGRVVADGAGYVQKVGQTVKDGISKAYNFTQKIPIVGGLVNTVLDAKIPLINVSARDVAGVADKALGAVGEVKKLGESIADGNVRGVIDTSKGLYQQGRRIGEGMRR